MESVLCKQCVLRAGNQLGYIIVLVFALLKLSSQANAKQDADELTESDYSSDSESDLSQRPTASKEDATAEEDAATLPCGASVISEFGDELDQAGADDDRSAQANGSGQGPLVQDAAEGRTPAVSPLVRPAGDKCDKKW